MVQTTLLICKGSSQAIDVHELHRKSRLHMPKSWLFSRCIQSMWILSGKTGLAGICIGDGSSPTVGAANLRQAPSYAQSNVISRTQRGSECGRASVDVQKDVYPLAYVKAVNNVVWTAWNRLDESLRLVCHDETSIGI